MCVWCDLVVYLEYPDPGELVVFEDKAATNEYTPKLTLCRREPCEWSAWRAGAWAPARKTGEQALTQGTAAKKHRWRSQEKLLLNHIGYPELYEI